MKQWREEGFVRKWNGSKIGFREGHQGLWLITVECAGLTAERAEEEGNGSWFENGYNRMPGRRNVSDPRVYTILEIKSLTTL